MPDLHGLSDDEVKTLTAKCLEAKARAYCPYSRFRVGATLLTISPAHPFIDGANVENAAYPSGVCAERAAIGAAVGGLGMRRGDFRALAVSTDLIGKEGSTDGFASPCGMCRQVIREFCDLDMPIFLHDATGKFIVKTLGELLPLSFGPETLPPPEALPTAGN